MIKQRESNIEVLRIVSMFFVLVIHANFLSNEAPTTSLAMQSPITAYTQFVFASISFTCVNIFVLISGWFGIRFKWRGVFSFLFQCIFWGIVGWGVAFILESERTFCFKDICTCLMLYEEDYWFVKSYLLLYFMAPLLNIFAENASKSQFLVFLICFYLFQSVFGWATYAVDFFEAGYSTMSFVGLYLLAKYTRIYVPKWSLCSLRTDICLILCIVLSTSVLSFVTVRHGINIVWIKMYSYINPVIIFESLRMVVSFSKFHFHNKFINWVAASAFAVYLLHCNTYIFRPYYVKVSQFLFQNYGGVVYVVYTALFMLFIFICAIIVDKIRIVIDRILFSTLFSRK